MQVGDIIEEAKIVNIKDFGVFVEISPFQNGLIHFSQIIPKVEYGNVSSNFKSIENPVIFAKVCNNVKKDDKIVNKTKLEGSIDGITVTDESIYETIIIEKEKQKKLPKTGC